jgi:hypothetical protein
MAVAQQMAFQVSSISSFHCSPLSLTFWQKAVPDDGRNEEKKHMTIFNVRKCTLDLFFEIELHDNAAANTMPPKYPFVQSQS